jgi:hypothetical protein
MFDTTTRYDLEQLANEARKLLKDSPRAAPGFTWQESINGIYFDGMVIDHVLSYYGGGGHEHIFSRTLHGFDPRCIALDFVKNFFAEVSDIICNPKRRSDAAKLSRRSLSPTCAGLAVFVMGKFGLSEPIAIAVATYLLIVFFEATKGAFCKMTMGQVESALEK